MDRAAEEYDAAQAVRLYHAHQIDAYFVLLAVIIAVIVLLAIWRNRRAIPGAIDNAAVTTLAAGLKVGRKLASGGKSYRDRIVDRAGH